MFKKTYNSPLEKLAHNYKSLALFLLNTLVVFLILNMFISLFFAVGNYFIPDKTQTANNPVAKKYGDSALEKVYPGLSKEDRDMLLQESWNRPFLYEPFTGFKERPIKGRFVNVDKNGFRHSVKQGPWPPDQGNMNIFYFGGSTTFGDGVADDQTVASYLQEYLADKLKRTVKIYNFGRGHYYSTQERILFEQLLHAGFVPDIAIFMDGLNDFYHNEDEPLFTMNFREFIAELVAGKGFQSKEWTYISKIPIVRAAQGIRRKIFDSKKSSDRQGEAGAANDGENTYDDPMIINRVIEWYVSNKKIIEAVSGAFGVQPVFVWQPVSTYNYDQRYHLFAKGDNGEPEYTKHGYKRMAEYIKTNPLGRNFLWCADLQQDFKEPLYVDQVHYSPRFSKLIAKNIGDMMIQRSLLNDEFKLQNTDHGR